MMGSDARWHVRLVVEGEAWREAWKHEASVWAPSSTAAVQLARADFYGLWTCSHVSSNFLTFC